MFHLVVHNYIVYNWNIMVQGITQRNFFIFYHMHVVPIRLSRHIGNVGLLLDGMILELATTHLNLFQTWTLLVATL